MGVDSVTEERRLATLNNEWAEWHRANTSGVCAICSGKGRRGITGTAGGRNSG